MEQNLWLYLMAIGELYSLVYRNNVTLKSKRSSAFGNYQ
jgi:hypothetical protein